MLTKRIIPCLDIKDGRTVKGTNFVSLRDAGDPVELAVRYCEEGADELVFLDITATHEKRKTLANLVRSIATHINIPFTVGGGISTIEDVSLLLENGADKISVNSSAVQHPQLIDQLARNFGSQCVVVAIDGKIIDGEWRVVTHGGRKPENMTVKDWAVETTKRGAGEILFTSMENDGTKQGFATGITGEIAGLVNVPVIASGGVGNLDDLTAGILQGHADAVLAASIFHFGTYRISEAKANMAAAGIEVRR